MRLPSTSDESEGSHEDEREQDHRDEAQCAAYVGIDTGHQETLQRKNVDALDDTKNKYATSSVGFERQIDEPEYEALPTENCSAGALPARNA